MIKKVKCFAFPNDLAFNLESIRSHDKKALITGIIGQDGSYLAEFLLGKGSEMHGIMGRASWINIQRVDQIYEDLQVKK